MQRLEKTIRDRAILVSVDIKIMINSSITRECVLPFQRLKSMWLEMKLTFVSFILVLFFFYRRIKDTKPQNIIQRYENILGEKLFIIFSLIHIKGQDNRRQACCHQIFTEAARLQTSQTLSFSLLTK